MSKSLQQILRLVQLTLYAKRDLMALLHGDPPCENQAASHQLVSKCKLTEQQ